MNPATPSGMTAERGTTSENLEVSEPAMLYDPAEELFTSHESGIDTATHHLPEPPGTDSIPIPVATTPDDN